MALYNYAEATAREVELLVVEKWRIATKRRSSGTRCYIAAAKGVDDLREERRAIKEYLKAKELEPGKVEPWARAKRGRG